MRILIADTDNGIRTRISGILMGNGYDCLEAGGFEEAIVLAGLPGPKLDLLVTDILIPPYHGGTLATRIQPFHPRLKVLFLSGQPVDALLACGLLVAEAAFLQKPFTEKQLLAAVTTACKKVPDWSKIVTEFALG